MQVYIGTITYIVIENIPTVVVAQVTTGSDTKKEESKKEETAKKEKQSIVMSKLTFENTSYWESASKYILSLPEIRFVGVINNMGHLIVGEYKKGIVPIAGIEQYKICMEHALELFMKKDLDDTLGPLDYIVSKRKNIKIITVPVHNYLVLISAESRVKIEPIIDEIIQSLKHMQRNN